MKATILLGLLPLLISAAVIKEKRQYTAFSITENQLTDGTPCRALTILFARGTFEPGNVGTLTGPPFFQAVANKIGADKVAVQGIEYPASAAGFQAGGDANGSALMAQTVATAMSRCPNTKLCLSGYSQGAQLVHNAAAMLSADQVAFVNSVMLFGDPDNGKPVGSISASKVDTDCHSDDNICQGGSNFFGSHLTYGNDASAAANFVTSQAGLS